MRAVTAGYRTPDGAWQWDAKLADGRLVAMSHHGADRISHTFPPGGVNEALLLYAGRFSLTSPGDPNGFRGNVTLRWIPAPHLEATGWRKRSNTFASVDQVRRWLEEQTQLWHSLPELHTIPAMSSPLPAPPTRRVPLRHSKTEILKPVQVFDSVNGDSSKLTELVAYLPNGYRQQDGELVADPSDRRAYWYSRGIAAASGWKIEIDSLNRSSEFWWELERTRGYGVSHIVRVTRTDSGIFTADEAANPLQATRYACSLALGRFTDLLLLDGRLNSQPVWTRWTAGQVAPFRTGDSWLDVTWASHQVAEAVRAFMSCWTDDLKRETLIHATSYYVQAIDLNAELGVAAAISGLLLLGSSWVVEQEHQYTRTQWDTPTMNAEAQIRALLELPACAIPTNVPAAFQNLENARASVAASQQPGHSVPDGLSTVICMRNKIMHPTRARTGRWNMQEWVEARQLAVHFLELALLAYSGYSGKIRPRICGPSLPGLLRDVPWIRPSAQVWP